MAPSHLEVARSARPMRGRAPASGADPAVAALSVVAQPPLANALSRAPIVHWRPCCGRPPCLGGDDDEAEAGGAAVLGLLRSSRRGGGRSIPSRFPKETSCEGVVTRRTKSACFTNVLDLWWGKPSGDGLLLYCLGCLGCLLPSTTHRHVHAVEPGLGRLRLFKNPCWKKVCGYE